MGSPPGSLTYTCAEAARALGVHESHIRRMAKRGELPSFMFGGRRLIAKTVLDTWMIEQSARQTAALQAQAVAP